MAESFYTVYTLQSEPCPDRYYVGFTTDLHERLAAHNGGACDHTKSFRPWKIKTAVLFTDKAQALAFETYLKSPSGRAFAKKRL